MRKIRTWTKGRGGPGFVQDKYGDQDHPAEDAGPGANVAPTPQHRLLETEHRQTDARSDQDGTDIVDRRPLVLGLGLGDGDEHQRNDCHGNVDPKDRSPRPLRQVTTEDGSDRGQTTGDSKEDARALPRSRSGKVCTTIATAAGNISAPPAPCTTRKPTIHASATLPLGVSPHMAEAPAKMMTPRVHMRRCPKMSDRRPPSGK